MPSPDSPIDPRAVHPVARVTAMTAPTGTLLQHQSLASIQRSAVNGMQRIQSGPSAPTASHTVIKGINGPYA